MNALAPQTVAAQLWNRLAAVGRDDGAEVDRILWQLRGLVARGAADFLAQVGIAYAYLLRGLREEALPHINAAWQLRHGKRFSELSNLGTVSIDCGRLSEGREIFLALLSVPEAQNNEFLLAGVHRLALRTGDIALFEQVEKATGTFDPDWRTWNQQIVVEDLVDAFQHHQMIVEKIVEQHTSMFSSEVMFDWEGKVGAYLEYFTGMDQDGCFELQDAIADAVNTEELIQVSRYVSVAVLGPYASRVEVAA